MHRVLHDLLLIYAKHHLKNSSTSTGYKMLTINNNVIQTIQLKIRQSTHIITAMFVLCLFCCYNKFADTTNLLKLPPIIK